MIHPAIVNVIHFFYPIGNTPAVCLTQDLPYLHAANILLLGYGDIRNILFTTYADTSSLRRLDITCCDIESAVIARNILLFSLLIDDVDGLNTTSIWNIYYHFYIDNSAFDLLQAQSRKLLKLATSVEAWHGSGYGRLLRFCNDGTFFSVQKIWKSYCISDLPAGEKDLYNSRFKASIQKALDARVAFLGEGQVITGLRSAAPTSLQALQDLPQLYQYFWDNGFTGLVPDKKNPNPMFAPLATDTYTLHYGLDPLLGYHLSAAYIPLNTRSPLKQKTPVGSQIHRVVKTAYLQFSEWSASFRKYARHSLILRFVSGDALSVCDAICLGKNLQYQYRSQYELDPIVLNGEDYDQGVAPLSFDIIDTSNLVDHIGAINVLVAASQLLKPKFLATLYTEVLVMKASTRKELLNTLLCGHFPTMSILLGLTPVEYWMNNTAISTVDEDFFETFSDPIGKKANKETERGQVRSRLAWKHSIPAADLGGVRPVICFDVNDLAHLLHTIYQMMFQHEDLRKLISELDINSLQNKSLLHYHRGSLAVLLKFIKSKVKVDWDAVMKTFLDLVETDQTTSMGLNYIQEFYTQLHIFGVFSMPIFDPKFDFQHHGKFPRGLGSWKNLPPIVCITLKVPRSKLDLFTSLSLAELGTPTVHCILESSLQSTSKWQNIFADLHMVFGKIVASGRRTGDEYRVDVIQDAQSWEGNSPLLASFWVPTWVVLLEPQTTVISFGVQSTPSSSRTFTKRLGYEMNVYKTNLTDENQVFITKFGPNQSSYGSTSRSGGYEREEIAISPTLPVFMATIDRQKAQIVALTGRIDNFTADIRAKLKDGADVNLTQISPFTLAIKVGQSGEYNLNFPAPVIHARSNTRIARKSSYVEIAASIADYVNGDGSSPTLCIQPSSMKLDLCSGIYHWLNTHVSFQMSARERKLRERQMAEDGEDHGDYRVDFKDSIFSIFIHFSGLQGQQHHIFGLNHPNGGGIHILIFVACMRLDMANHTVLLDAAILPLTNQLMPRIHSSLQALTGMGFCQIKVNDQELRLWRENVAAFVERSRQWEHLSTCEYKTASAIPISLENGQPLLCSCGLGKLPANFVSGVPHWNVFSKYAIRAAISPSFSLSYVEKIFDTEGLDLPPEPRLDVCHKCQKSTADGEIKLKSCSRCQTVKYCSTDCQRLDWNFHKRSCVAAEKPL